MGSLLESLEWNAIVYERSAGLRESYSYVHQKHESLSKRKTHPRRPEKPKQESV